LVPEEPLGTNGWPTTASIVSVPDVSRPELPTPAPLPPLGTPFWQMPVTQMASLGQSEFCEHFATLGCEHAASVVVAAIASKSDLVIRSSRSLMVN